MNKQIEKLLELVQVNEQIERLAKQAGCTIDRMGYGEGNLEMFAELIIKECARIANAGIDPAESHLIGNYILEHFGVEE